ncbi:hypothetical protein, partial [Streptomyces sp. NPDC002187]|uniref:hypothetical protein n=1 Tax=Streptomyces sp. NPDC002187 TaxID=3364637 RepID=UPI0036F1D353
MDPRRRTGRWRGIDVRHDVAPSLSARFLGRSANMRPDTDNNRPRETMPALLRRATRIATLSAALFVACAALPPAAHAYRASPGYGNEADLDRHDTYRN